MRLLTELSHLDLCCLQKSIIIACGSERVNSHYSSSLNIVFSISFNIFTTATSTMDRILAVVERLHGIMCLGVALRGF